MAVDKVLNKYGHFWKCDYKEHLKCISEEHNVNLDTVYNTAFYLGPANTVFLLRNIMRYGNE